MSVKIDDRILVRTLDSSGGFNQQMVLTQTPYSPLKEATDTSVPLISLAWARSGDKGDHANIGVIARNAEYLPFIKAALTEQAVTDFMAHTLCPDNGKVTRWDLPGINAVNFLLEHSLGGGGVASLRIDPQGKAFAQQLLEFEIPVTSAIANSI